jgi:hypothetical protein
MYLHFAQRLKERYGLEITPLEYIDLIQASCETIEKEKGTGRRKVKLRFKDTIIYAVKENNGNKFLITALNPMPN